MKKKIFFLVALTSFFLSCDELPNNVEPNDERIPIKIAMSPLTKVSNNLFEDGDKVGLYVTNYENTSAGSLLTIGNHVDNAMFTKSGLNWNPEESLFWKDSSTPADLYAYYPYSQVTDVNAHAISVELDQSNIENYESSYFLWGKVEEQLPTESPISIQTNHLMSSLSVYVAYGESFTEEDLKFYNIDDIKIKLKATAEVDLATGVVTATGNVKSITPYKSADCYQAIVVPQTVSTGLISVTVNGDVYNLDYNITLRPNTKHKLNVVLNKEKLSSTFDFSIGSWEEDSDEHNGEIGIDNLASKIIEFTHSEVKDYCVEYYDANGDGELSELEAAQVTDIECPSSYLTDKPLSGKSFNEFVYFVSVEEIGEFFLLASLEEVTLPPSITYVGNGLLSNIYSVKFTSLVPPTIEGTGGLQYVYVPQESESLYREALAGHVYGEIFVY